MAKLVVVGAGIMGLSVARSATKAGHEVTVLERGPGVDDRIASVDESRLIRHPYGAMFGYARMIDSAYAAWDRLWDDLGVRHYRHTGTLCLGEGDSPSLARSAEGVRQAGQSVEWLDRAEIESRFDPLAPPASARGFYVDTGGVLFAKAIVSDLLRWTERHGTTLRTHAPVATVDLEDASCTLTSGEVVNADRIVLALGAWTPDLMKDAAPIQPSRQAVLYASVPSPMASAWSRMPLALSIDPGSSGSYWVPSATGATLKMGDHTFNPGGHPDQDRELTSRELQELMNKAGRWLRSPALYTVLRGTSCYYAVAPQEAFVVRPLSSRSWMMAGFSGHGFKFGPLLGERVIAAMDGQVSSDEVQRWAAGG